MINLENTTTQLKITLLQFNQILKTHSLITIKEFHQIDQADLKTRSIVSLKQSISSLKNQISITIEALHIENLKIIKKQLKTTQKLQNLIRIILRLITIEPFVMTSLINLTLQKKITLVLSISNLISQLYIILELSEKRSEVKNFLSRFKTLMM